MIRITRETDYGIVLLTLVARDGVDGVHAARELADEARLPAPMVSKILKRLARHGLLVSHRGAKGGYSLARSPEAISVAEVIRALEGPIALTECTVASPGSCEQEPRCPTRSNWQKINQAIGTALEQISLAEMTVPMRKQQVALRLRAPVREATSV